MSENNQEVEINIKKCYNCNEPDGVVKFQKYKKICTKCNSKLSNQKVKTNDPSYFKNVMKSRYVYHGQVGRPKKGIENNL